MDAKLWMKKLECYHPIVAFLIFFLSKMPKELKKTKEREREREHI
jgi:hypothetical protein